MFDNGTIVEELMREAFSPYGNIQEVRTFPDKGFAFVRCVQHSITHFLFVRNCSDAAI